MSTFSYRPFESLKKLLEKSPPATNKTHLPVIHESTNDEELFREAMADVKEIEEFRQIPYVSPKVTVSAEKRLADSEVLKLLADIVSGRMRISLADTQEYTEWVNPEYKREFSKMLHSGRFSIQDSIDLHGYTVSEAKILVKDFLKGSLQRGNRCVKIIHGRGLRSAKGPVLKEALLSWLRGGFRKWVIAFATARACDGGLGATYVLLKP